MEILAYCAAVLIGISLGMIGSGGSILTVPVLVYLLHINPVAATTSSLFIVGLTSLTGSIRAYSRGQVDFRTVSEFGIPSIFSIFLARHFLLPALPDILFSVEQLTITREVFLMALFALLMLGAALSMILERDGKQSRVKKSPNAFKNTFILIVLGLFIGLITGLLGAGGGFLIIPSLVLILRLPMKKAVGTSLLLIAINSVFGFLFSLKQFDYNWTILLGFTALSIAGLFIGSRLAEKIPAIKLKKGFGWFVLIIAFYILLREFLIQGRS
jgi:uncharacterized protein